MEIENKYAGKLFFPRSNFLQIYFEAIANAFDAKADEIIINIKSDGERSPEYLEIEVKDNGVGLTDNRFDKFSRLKKPDDPYHKGLGRLVYLQYFDKVEVDSCYGDKIRLFTFSNDFEGDCVVGNNKNNRCAGTSLVFKSFAGERLQTYDHLNPSFLKGKIIEQFLPILTEKKKNKIKFKITINLEVTKRHKQPKLFDDDLEINWNDIPDFKTINIQDIKVIPLQPVPVDISYFVSFSGFENTQLTALNVDGRTVPIDLFSKNILPQGYSATFLFESQIFLGASDSSRLNLALPETVPKDKVLRILRKEISKVLNEEIPMIAKKNESTKKAFEDKFPHLNGYFEEDTVGVIDKDEAISMAQSRFFADQKKVLESEELDEDLFKKSLEISSRTLTEYILYRELIIKKLEEKILLGNEDTIHNLIVPRFNSYCGDKIIDNIFNNNAWVLDDKFMSFRTILSEKRMTEVISAITLDDDKREQDGRPDISMIFSADPGLSEKVDVVIVEIKKKDIHVREKMHASVQLAERANKLVEHCPNIQRMWYFAVIDIDEDFAKILRTQRWTPLYSKGAVFYSEFEAEGPGGIKVPAPTFFISYDAIIKDAASRNHTFLEILKCDLKKLKDTREEVLEKVKAASDHTNIKIEESNLIENY